MKLVYGVNPNSGWGIFVIIRDDKDGTIQNQLLAVCPGFADKKEFVDQCHALIVRQMENDGILVAAEATEEENGSKPS